MSPRALPLLLSAACSVPDRGKVAGEGVVDGVGDTGEGGEAPPEDPWIVADQGAFLAASGPVAVSGTAGGLGVTSVWVGAERVPLQAGRWTAEVDLGDGPWTVLELVAEGDDGEARAAAQAAWAVAGSAPLVGAAATAAGRDAVDALAAHMARFVDPAALAPPPGTVLLSRSCFAPPFPGLEAEALEQQLIVADEVDLSLQVAVDPARGSFALDLTGSALTWGVEVLTLREGGFEQRQAGALDVALPGAAPPSPRCGALGLDLELGVAERSWSTDFTFDPPCFTGEEAGAAADLWFDATAGAELERAACAWGGWLDEALAQDLTGVGWSRAAALTVDGLRVDWAAELARAPAVVSPPGSEIPEGMGVLSRMDAALAGAALHAQAKDPAALAADGALDDGRAVRVVGRGFEAGRASLGGFHPGAALLPAPLAYQIEVDGAVCEEGLAVPDLLPLTVEAAAGGHQLDGVGAPLAGASRSGACAGLDGALRAELLADLVRQTYGSLALSWSSATGLQDIGAGLVGAEAGTGWAQDVEVPSP
jgi:hypothetical protein